MNRVSGSRILVSLVTLILMFGAAYLGIRGLAGGPYGSWAVTGERLVNGTFLMWLIPLSTLVLLVLGIAWVAQSLGGKDDSRKASGVCRICSHRVQPDWKICPYCAAKLR
jgi:uncharacterized membrane protein